MSDVADVRALIAEARDALAHYAQHEWEWKMLQRLANALEAAHAEPDDDRAAWQCPDCGVQISTHGTTLMAQSQRNHPFECPVALKSPGFRRRGTPATVEQVAEALETMLRSSWSENATWLAEQIEGRFIVLNREPTEEAD